MEFSELLQQSRSRVFGFLYAIVLNMADTEDLFQQTASLLWEKFDEFEPGTDFTSWALRVARYKAANFMRSRYREQKRFSNAVIESLYVESVNTNDTPHQERIDALKECLNKLSDADRDLVQKCYAGGQRIKEVALAEGRTANALYAALHRIRRGLTACVRQALALN